MSAKINVTWPRKSPGSVLAAAPTPADLGIGGRSCGQARIQAVSPWRQAKARPQPALVPSPPTAWLRRAS